MVSLAFGFDGVAVLAGVFGLVSIGITVVLTLLLGSVPAVLFVLELLPAEFVVPAASSPVSSSLFPSLFR